NDPIGAITHPGKVSKNVAFSPDPIYTSGDASVAFTIRVVDPLQDAYAAVLVVDVAGNDSLVELFYKAPKLTVSPAKLSIQNVSVGTDSCSKFVFHNFGDKAIQVTGASLKYLDPTLSIDPATLSNLPFSLKPGDSLAI